ncbi:hypothetical protein KL86DES1_21188 [uncultured Desulfovibrio sp.]|uniref:Uncharacterized protein n=1 Tax=uncultured Desulfovibrio sp. TaxID=167968 RepID=A0A212L6Q7_9BACT|nr:hypothetical protein KL86DES1_21188 [uncultured Desulfovibrio sp.]VZH34084.1 conserved protein of unknown function [Desulfovibrio sp. 86]
MHSQRAERPHRRLTASVNSNVVCTDHRLAASKGQSVFLEHFAFETLLVSKHHSGEKQGSRAGDFAAKARSRNHPNWFMGTAHDGRSAATTEEKQGQCQGIKDMTLQRVVLEAGAGGSMRGWLRLGFGRHCARIPTQGGAFLL